VTETPEGQAEVREARAEHDAAVDRWDASLGKAHPDEVEANYQAMNDAGVRLSDVADRYPEAWWAAEEADVGRTAEGRAASAGLGTADPEPGEPGL
jgi:hypothetical protein